MKKITLPTISGPIEIDHWNHLKNLVEISASLNKGIQLHFEKLRLQYVDVPAIVGITGACENVDTLFKVGNRLGIPLFFTQTGQLALEQALQKFAGVWTIIYSGRDEEEEDSRHLRQFRLTEEEFGWATVEKNKKYDADSMFEHLLDHIQKVTKSALIKIVKDNSSVLSKIYKRNLNELQTAIKKDFQRISYSTAVELLQKNGFPNLTWGDDLKANHEQKIVDLLSDKTPLPTFITHYPKEIKFFNMKVSQKDPRVVHSADLILPISGESAGSAVREENGQKLKERLLSSNMFRLHQERGGSYDDFTWYIEDIICAGKTQPHAGYGLGNERLMQYVVGTTDIRQASVLSLMAKESGDWNEKRRGQSLLFSHQKTILVSIGKISDKRLLLPVIKKVTGDGILFYATEGTHKFLKTNGAPSTLVYKISQKGKPNLGDLIPQNKFDLIINIPNSQKNKPELFDWRLIRKFAVDTGTNLITDTEVAYHTLEKLSQHVSS